MPGVDSVLLDTDSPSGSPLGATEWVACPLDSQSRVDASIHDLLQLEPIGLSADQASAYHGHSAKRFVLNFMDASPEFDAHDSNEFGRFSGSTAQQNDLAPVAAMLHQHSLRAAVLPDIYATSSRVSLALDRVVRVQESLRRWACLLASGEVQAPHEDGWEAFRLPPPGDQPIGLPPPPAALALE